MSEGYRSDDETSEKGAFRSRRDSVSSTSSTSTLEDPALGVFEFAGDEHEEIYY
jgi:hypothetical protein